MSSHQEQLNISHLNEIDEILTYCNFNKTEWLKLGLKLGLSLNTLKTIETNYKEVDRCLLECLNKWLSKADNVTTPTGQTLATALRRISEVTVAELVLKIMTDPASCILQYYSNRLSLSTPLIQLLFKEGIILKETADEIEQCGGVLVDDSLRKVCVMVAEDRSKLRLLASILLTSSDTKSLAEEILQEYDETFPGSSVAMSSVPVNPDNNTAIQTVEGATAVEVTIHPGYKAEFDRIGDALGSLLHSMATMIEASIPSLTDLKSFLKRCRPHLKVKLEDKDTFDSIMEVIEEECSVINIAILESIVHRYSINDASDYILAYQTSLDEFCENSLTMCCNYQFKRLSSPLLICETIKFVLKWNPSEHSLSSIKGLLWKTFKDNRVEVVVIKEGNSIIVTCYAPHYLMESLLLIARGNLDLLKELGLISLDIGYYTLYDERNIEEEVRCLEKKLKWSEEEKEALVKENEELLVRLKSFEKHVTNDTKTEIVPTDEQTLTDTDNLSSESELKERLLSKEKMLRAMRLEIDQLQYSLQSKAGLEEKLKEEIEALQEKISLQSVQLIDTSHKIQKLQDITDRSLMYERGKPAQKWSEQIQVTDIDDALLKFAMTYDHPLIQKITNCGDTLYNIIQLLLNFISEDPLLLAELKYEKERHETGREETGEITWASEWVWLTSPSPRQCREVISQMSDSHKEVRLYRSTSKIFILIPQMFLRPTVKKLRIQSTPLNEACISNLSLSKNNRIQELNLYNCSINNECVSILCNDLHHNTTLRILAIWGNPDVTSSLALSELLLNNTTLVFLDIRNNSISSNDIKIILDSLRTKTSFGTLLLDLKHKPTCKTMPYYNQIKNRINFV